MSTLAGHRDPFVHANGPQTDPHMAHRQIHSHRLAQIAQASRYTLTPKPPSKTAKATHAAHPSPSPLGRPPVPHPPSLPACPVRPPSHPSLPSRSPFPFPTRSLPPSHPLPYPPPAAQQVHPSIHIPPPRNPPLPRVVLRDRETPQARSTLDGRQDTSRHTQDRRAAPTRKQSAQSIHPSRPRRYRRNAAAASTV